jgi:hypothetical protein
VLSLLVDKENVFFMKVKAHQRGSDFFTQGNNKADKLAKLSISQRV